MKVVIMVGASGSGKTTWIEENLPHATVVSTDGFFERSGSRKFDKSLLEKAHAWAIRDFIMQCAMQAPTIVVDNTNTTAVEIAPYIAIAKAYDAAEIQVIWLGTDNINELVRRNVHNVQEHTIRRHIDNMARTKMSWPFHWPMPKEVFE